MKTKNQQLAAIQQNLKNEGKTVVYKDFATTLENYIDSLCDYQSLLEQYRLKQLEKNKDDLTLIQLENLSAKISEFNFQSVSNRIKFAKDEYKKNKHFVSFLDRLNIKTETDTKDLLTYNNYLNMHNTVKIEFTESAEKTVGRKIDYLYFNVVKLNFADTFEKETDLYKETRSNLYVNFAESDDTIQKIDFNLSLHDVTKYEFIQLNSEGILLKSKKIKDNELYTIKLNYTYNFKQLYSQIRKYLVTLNNHNNKSVQYAESLFKNFGYDRNNMIEIFNDRFFNDKKTVESVYKDFKNEGSLIEGIAKSINRSKSETKSLLADYTAKDLKYFDMSYFSAAVHETIRETAKTAETKETKATAKTAETKETKETAKTADPGETKATAKTAETKETAKETKPAKGSKKSK